MKISTTSRFMAKTPPIMLAGILFALYTSGSIYFRNICRHSTALIHSRDTNFCTMKYTQNCTKKYYPTIGPRIFFGLFVVTYLKYAPKQPQTTQSILTKKYMINIFSGFSGWTHRNTGNIELIDVFGSMVDGLWNWEYGLKEIQCWIQFLWKYLKEIIVHLLNIDKKLRIGSCSAKQA